MTIIDNNIILDQPIGEVYAFLADLNNHERLMPESISNWSSTQDRASFQIQNMGNLTLKVQQREANEAIVLIPEGHTPFPLSMKWSLQAINEQQTKATLAIHAELNMMMKMIASAPLKKLTETETTKLKELL